MSPLRSPLSLALLALGACPEPNEPPKHTHRPEADTDADTDSDADADADSDADTDIAGSLRTETLSATSGPDGLAEFEIEVLPGETSFLFTAYSSSKPPSIEDLEDPSGARILDWVDWNGRYSLTDAFWPYEDDIVLNWPVRDVDPELVAGVYRVRIAAGNYVPNTPIDATIQYKADADLGAGEVRVRIVYAEGIDEDVDVVTAIEAAVVRWKEVWAPYGLTLLESYETSTADPDLSYPSSNNSDVLEISEGSDGEQLVLLVGESFPDRWTYGYAGGIPGPLVPSGRGAVELSWLSHVGQDGVFDDDEIGLMGETMAHEIGHYMGLYHPVEDGYDLWDALDDTVDCTTWQSCESQLGENLMFPYSICGGGDCVDTYLLTPQQQGVLHRYTGVLGL